MNQKLKVEKPMPYAGKRREVGDIIEVPPALARVLVAVGKCSHADAPGAKRNSQAQKTGNAPAAAAQNDDATEGGAQTAAIVDEALSNLIENPDSKTAQALRARSGIDNGGGQPATNEGGPQKGTPAPASGKAKTRK